MKEFTPLVSVILPCFNYGSFLADALNSILDQTFTEWECIIVDDGSTDKTKDVASSYVEIDNRFKLLSQENAGVSAARNLALKIAKGKYLQFLDADDLLESDKFKLQVKTLEDNDSIDLVYSSIMIFTDNGANRVLKPFKMSVEAVSGKGRVLLNALICDNIFLPGCVLFRRELYNQVGDFDKELIAFEDWDYWFKAALKNSTFYYDGRIGTRLLSRSHGNNVSKQRYKMWKYKIIAREKIMDFSRNLYAESAENQKEILDDLERIHKEFLSQDKSRYYFLFGNILLGFKFMVIYSYYSRNIVSPLYEGAYLLKERVLKEVFNK